MKIMHAFVGTLSVSLLFGLLTTPSARAEDKPVTLGRTAKADEKARYKIVIKADIPVGQATLTTIRKDVVKEVKENGDIVTLVTPESADAEVVGMPIDVPLPPPYT